MGILRRAMLYISRKKARSLLLLVIFVFMGLLTTASLSIKGSADQASDALKKSLLSSFEVKVSEVDDPSYYETASTGDGGGYTVYTGPAIDSAMIERIMDIDHVTQYSTTYEAYLYSDDIDLRPCGWAETLRLMREEPGYGDSVLFEEQTAVQAREALYYGSLDSSLHEFFRNGAFELSEGRHISGSDRNKVVISEELAARNGLRVGDTYTVMCKDTFNPDHAKVAQTLGEPIPLEVVGIFRINFQQEITEFTCEDQYAGNFCFTDMATIREYLQNNGVDPDTDRHSRVTFFIDDPAKMDEVLSAAKNAEGIDWQYYSIRADEQAYQSTAGPIIRIDAFYSCIVVLAVAGSFIILYCLMQMWTKARQREIGILRAVGISQKQVVLQLIAECLVVALIAFVCTCLFSSVFTQSLGSLSEAVATPQAGQASLYRIEYVYGGPGNAISKVAAERPMLDYAASPAVIGLVGAIGAVVAVLSVAAGTVHIVRRSPKDILSGR